MITLFLLFRYLCIYLCLCSVYTVATDVCNFHIFFAALLKQRRSNCFAFKNIICCNILHDALVYFHFLACKIDIVKMDIKKGSMPNALI